MTRTSFSVLPRRFYRTRVGRFLAHLPQEIAYYLVNRNPYVPPPHKLYTGRGDFLAVGQEFFDYFIRFGRIGVDSCILDIGSGLGRMAVPFTTYLSDKGEYWGFDVVAEGPRWCRRKISSRHPNFHFDHLDVYNELYNKRGHLQPEHLRFPYPDGKFDFAFLTSVFTHMSPADIVHYLQEIGRVLKPGGRALITANLLNEESRGRIATGNSPMKFHLVPGGKFASIDPHRPYDDIALNEEWLLSEAKGNGFSLCTPILYGSWCGRRQGTSCQDLLVFERRGKS